MQDFIQDLFSDPDMLRMGHGQRAEDQNLGLGWLYYALGRMFRPEKSLVIGSYRGFAPVLMAKAQVDNTEQGELIFVDPSLVDDFWTDAERVQGYFESMGTPNMQHFRYTTQEFVETEAYRALDGIGLFLIDGYHTAEQARFDYLSFCHKLTDDAVVMLHDSKGDKRSTIYGKDKPYQYSVYQFVERLQETPGLEVFNIPLASGLTLVRGCPETLEIIERPFE